MILFTWSALIKKKLFRKIKLIGLIFPIRLTENLRATIKYENPDILLYICDTIDNQQAQRERLFLSWFNRYGKGRFTIITAKVSSGDEDEYVAMILQNNHPHYDAITHQFKKEIAMFKENK